MLISIFPCSWHSAIPVGTGPAAAAMFEVKEAAVESLFNFCGEAHYLHRPQQSQIALVLSRLHNPATVENNVKAFSPLVRINCPFCSCRGQRKDLS